MGSAISFLQVTVHKVKNVNQNVFTFSFIEEPITLEEQEALVFFDEIGYLYDLKDGVKPYSKLFFPLSGDMNETIWVHIPNDLTNQQFYNFCSNNYFLVNDPGKLNIFDFEDVENVKRYPLMFTALSFLCIGAFLGNSKEEQIKKLLFLSVVFVILATIIIWGVQSNHAPKTFIEITEFDEAGLIPLNKNAKMNEKAIIPASSLQEFTKKVLDIIEKRKGLPLSLPTVASQKTYCNGTSTSSIIYKDEQYIVEFSAITPNSELSTHTHNVDVVVIPLTDGLSGTLDGEVLNEFTKYKPLFQKAGVNHSFKVGSEGGYLISIHSSSTPSLFLDI